MSAARFLVNVVNRMRARPGRCRASHRARCMATTVLPVPAAPRTRAGPFHCRSTRRRCEGWRNTRQRSSGALSIASSSSSSSTTHEAAPRLVARQRGGEVSRVDRLRRRLPVPDKLLVTLARQVEEEGLVGFQGQARLHPIQLGVVPHRAHLGEHGGRDSEPRQLPVSQLAEGRWCRRRVRAVPRRAAPRSRSPVRRKARTPAGRPSRG